MVTKKDAEEKAIQIAGITKEELKEVEKAIIRYYGKRDLAKQILKIQPFYYDEAKNWWRWNKIKFCWAITDETNIVNMINALADVNTVKTKERTEILEALRQEARLKKPVAINSSWIQFQNEIIDINTGERFEASPEYFVTNPIPYKLHNDNFEQTPVMDRIFEEWVGKDYVQTLYEIIAYCLLPAYPLHRLFCFIGAGMNGKSKFLELLRKFVGEENCCSTELDSLINSRFEITRLHKKLVCQMGETNFNEMSKTSIIKKLTGDDLIGFEYKNKNPFEDKNYAKILIATNNLPTTTDKTIGFYRRWLIVDFPHQFSEQKDILAEIPEEEYEALALKCTGILKDLLKKRAFHNEGSIEDRRERYEAKSNFLDKFIKENIVSGCLEDYISSSDFYKKFTSWCKENKYREMSETSVGIGLKKAGFEQERKYFNWMWDGKGGQMRVWVGLKWKN